MEKETKTEEKMELGEKEEKHKTGGGEGNIRKDEEGEKDDKYKKEKKKRERIK